MIVGAAPVLIQISVGIRAGRFCFSRFILHSLPGLGAPGYPATDYRGAPRGGGTALNRKPTTNWTVEELKKIIARKLAAAAKSRPGPKRQKPLREAKRYRSLLDTKT